jgi:hypothetical protein
VRDRGEDGTWREGGRGQEGGEGGKESIHGSKCRQTDRDLAGSSFPDCLPYNIIEF